TGIELGPQVQIVLEGQRRYEEQVVEVQRIGVAQFFFVDRIDAGNGLAEEVAGPFRVALRSQELILRLADGRLDALRGKTDVIDIGRFQGSLDQTVAVLLIIDRKVAPQAQAVRVQPHQAGAQAVNRAD